HAKRLCTFEIEREYKFGWLLDGKISRIRALKNSIDVIGGALTQREYVRAIGHEPARADVFAIFVDGGQRESRARSAISLVYALKVAVCCRISASGRALSIDLKASRICSGRTSRI